MGWRFAMPVLASRRGSGLGRAPGRIVALSASYPRIWDQRFAATPALHDSVLEPLILEVGVIERDHLQTSIELPNPLVHQLVQLARVLPVGVIEFIEVTSGLAIGREERLAWLVKHYEARNRSVVGARDPGGSLLPPHLVLAANRAGSSRVPPVAPDRQPLARREATPARSQSRPRGAGVARPVPPRSSALLPAGLAKPDGLCTLRPQDRLHSFERAQSGAGELRQVLGRLARVRIAPGERAREREVAAQRKLGRQPIVLVGRARGRGPRRLGSAGSRSRRLWRLRNPLAPHSGAVT